MPRVTQLRTPNINQTVPQLSGILARANSRDFGSDEFAERRNKARTKAKANIDTMNALMKELDPNYQPAEYQIDAYGRTFQQSDPSLGSNPGKFVGDNVGTKTTDYIQQNDGTFASARNINGNPRPSINGVIETPPANTQQNSNIPAEQPQNATNEVLSDANSVNPTYNTGVNQQNTGGIEGVLKQEKAQLDRDTKISGVPEGGSASAGGNFAFSTSNSHSKTPTVARQVTKGQGFVDRTENMKALLSAQLAGGGFGDLTGMAKTLEKGAQAKENALNAKEDSFVFNPGQESASNSQSGSGSRNNQRSQQFSPDAWKKDPVDRNSFKTYLDQDGNEIDGTITEIDGVPRYTDVTYHDKTSFSANSGLTAAVESMGTNDQKQVKLGSYTFDLGGGEIKDNGKVIGRYRDNNGKIEYLWENATQGQLDAAGYGADNAIKDQDAVNKMNEGDIITKEDQKAIHERTQNYIKNVKTPFNNAQMVARIQQSSKTGNELVEDLFPNIKGLYSQKDGGVAKALADIQDLLQATGRIDGFNPEVFKAKYKSWFNK